MGQLRRVDTKDELLFYEWPGEASAKPETARIVDLDDDGDHLSAATGAFWGVILGGLMWAVILWVLF